MTKAQHTSGPWQLPTGFESVHPCEHEGLPVFADNDPFDTIAMVMPREDGNANATLIAAAPDLLEALESLYILKYGYDQNT